MDYYKNRNFYSKYILLLIVAFYILNYLMEGKLAALFSLVPSAVIENLEFWRLVTFPLAPGPLEGILLFAFTFYVIAPKLEEFLKNGVFLAFLIPLIFLQGIIYTLVFWNSPFILAGLEGVSFFVLTLFTFLNPRQYVRLWFFPPRKIFVFTFLIITFWCSLKYFNHIYSGYEITIQSVSPAIFGILTGAVTYLQFKLIRRLLSRKNAINDFEIPQPEDRKLAMISQAKMHSFNSNPPDEGDVLLDGEQEFNEQKLDEILDKIIDKGKESLLPHEIKFLEDYSKHL